MSSKILFKRLPIVHNPTLKAHNAADEWMVKYAQENQIASNIAIYNDSYGYLSFHFNQAKPFVIKDLKSQEQSIIKNLGEEKIQQIQFYTLLDELPEKPQHIFLKIPKSLAYFEMMLQHIHKNSTENCTVICGFMTKYFTASILKIAEKYFENISQTLAFKKSRLMILNVKKNIESQIVIESFNYKNIEIKQYPGVFSSEQIDYATQFLLENIEAPETPIKILDLACGNGIIGRFLQEKNQESTYYFMDDSFLAIASAKMNINHSNSHFIHAFDLNYFENNSLDRIITNPPFHFGHEIDINIPLELFKQSYEKLKPNGILTIVANKHLNYKSHLEKYFQTVLSIKENEKFVIYECVK